MTKGLLILLGLLYLIGAASAMGSLNFDFNWNVIGGGGGALTSLQISVLILPGALRL